MPKTIEAIENTVSIEIASVSRHDSFPCEMPTVIFIFSLLFCVFVLVYPSVDRHTSAALCLLLLPLILQCPVCVSVSGKLSLFLCPCHLLSGESSG